MQQLQLQQLQQLQPQYIHHQQLLLQHQLQQHQLQGKKFPEPTSSAAALLQGLGGVPALMNPGMSFSGMGTGSAGSGNSAIDILSEVASKAKLERRSSPSPQPRNEATSISAPPKSPPQHHHPGQGAALPSALLAKKKKGVEKPNPAIFPRGKRPLPDENGRPASATTPITETEVESTQTEPEAHVSSEQEQAEEPTPKQSTEESASKKAKLWDTLLEGEGTDLWKGSVKWESRENTRPKDEDRKVKTIQV
jgi:hypothetical protein